MTDAPERIWAKHRPDCEGVFPCSKYDGDAIEYIRADLSPALGAVAMMEAAAWEIETAYRQGRAGQPIDPGPATRAARAIPLPSDADLDRAALARPKVAALVNEVREFNRRVMDGEIRSTKTFNAFCNILAALESSHE